MEVHIKISHFKSKYFLHDFTTYKNLSKAQKEKNEPTHLPHLFFV